MVTPPFQEVMVPVRGEATYAATNGAVEATAAFERRDALLASPSLVTLSDVNNKNNFCQGSTGLNVLAMKTKKPEWSTFYWSGIQFLLGIV